MRQFLVICLLAVTTAVAHAAPPIPPEQVLVIKTSGGVIEVDKRLVRKPVARITSQVKAADKELDMERAYPFDVKLSANDKRYFHVFCDSGPSGDPNCRLADASCDYLSDKCPLVWEGQNLFIPGDGCVYDHGGSDDYFDRHARYCLQGKKLVPAKQPYYYVGMKTVAQALIILYEDEKLENTLEKIMPGEALEVVLAQPRRMMCPVIDGETSGHPSSSHDTDQGNEYATPPASCQNEQWSPRYDTSSIYLIKDSQGLVGWAKIQEGMLGDKGDIKGLFFNGD